MELDQEKSKGIEIMLFTFGVMAYNQAEIILETLESIKYQVIHYGDGKLVSLYITDDCSNDNTALVCSKWITENGYLFYDCDLLINEKNKGTVKNYKRLLELISGNEFKIIAGDDLLCSSTNIFEEVLSINDRTMLIGTPLFLQGDKIASSEQRMIDALYYSHKTRSKQYDLNMIMRGGYFNTPACLITKQLFIDSSADSFLNKFYLFEDDPTWFSIVKNVDNIKLVFSKNVFVIYRMSSSSVSQPTNKNSIFSLELKKLHNEYVAFANPITRILLRFQDSRLPRFLRLDLYYKHLFNKYKKAVVKIKYKPEYSLYKSNIEAIRRIEEERYGIIKKGIL